MTKARDWVVGHWRIESIDQWDRDFIDAEARGHFEFWETIYRIHLGRMW